MRFRLIPREEKFFDLFDELTTVLTRASGKFVDMVTSFDRLRERKEEMEAEEHAADDLVGRIIQALDRTFITPFDREDIHNLATHLDDVLDNMEETAHRLEAFRITRPTEAAVRLATIAHECCQHLESAIKLCRTMKK